MNRQTEIRRSRVIRKWCILLALLGLAVAIVPREALAKWSVTPHPETWVTNGSVTAMAQSGHTMYLGGSFTRLGPDLGAGIPLDKVSAQPLAVYPRVDGFVYACLADGAGGWYIAGDFATVAGKTRNHIAHILPDSTLDPAWNPGADDDIETLFLAGSTLYVGGDFSTIGGQPRPHAAALDAATGQVLGWLPQANGTVYAYALSGSTLYVGGSFTQIGNQTHSGLAAYDTTNLTSTSLPLATFVPWLNGPVYSICVSGSSVYAGGVFSRVNGALVRDNLASFDSATGLPTSWAPEPDGTIESMFLSGSTLYIGGLFGTVSHQTRHGLAALVAGGALTSWDPNANGEVQTILLDGTTVYVGGQFTTIHGQANDGLAAVDLASGVPSAWAPEPNGDVYALAVNASTVYAGGAFSSVGGVNRSHIAAIDTLTGKPTSFAPNADGTIGTLLVNGTTLYAAGSFHTIGGATRPYLAAIDLASGLVTGWQPQPSDVVESIAVQGQTLYAGGYFTNIGGAPRNFVGAVSTTSSLATAWSADANAPVYAVAVDGTRLYVGGDFTNISTATLTGIAALDTRTARPIAGWNAHSNAAVKTILPAGNTLYVAGDFLIIGGNRFHYFAELNAADGSGTDFNPLVSDSVYAVALAGADVLVGGAFSGIGNRFCNYLADVSRTSGNAADWFPNANGAVYAIEGVTPYTFWIGGGFSSIGTVPRRGIAQFDAVFNVTFTTDGTTSASLTGNTNQTVIAGTNATSVTAVAPPGYHFSKWTLNGALYSRANPLTVTNVQADTALVAVFSSPYVVTFDTDGSYDTFVTGSTYQALAFGADATTVTAGWTYIYHFLNWDLDGAYYSNDTTLAVHNVRRDMEFVAIYSSNTFSVEFQTGDIPGTTLTGATPQFVPFAQACTPVSANPPAGYQCLGWRLNGIDYSADNPVTVTFVTSNMVLTPIIVPDANVWILK